MAYDLVRANTPGIRIGDLSAALDLPLTFAGRFYLNNTADNAFLFAFHDGLNPSDRHQLTARGAVTNDPIRAESTRDDGAVSGDSAINGFSATTWYSVAGKFSAANSRTVYLEGTAGTTNTSSVETTGIVKGVIGSTYSVGAFVAGLGGRAAECAAWSAALTDDEIVSLSKGFKPTRIRPQSLVLYVPLVRDLIELRNALTLTNSNSATVADHPRVY